MSENEERRSGSGEPGGLADLLIFKPPLTLLRLILFSKFLIFSSDDFLVGEVRVEFLLGLTSYIRLPF